QLVPPVSDDGGWTDQQCWPSGRLHLVLPGMQEQRDELDRLPEAHIVGQTGPEPARAQLREPAEANFLVPPQPSDEAGRLGGRLAIPRLADTVDERGEAALSRYLDCRAFCGGVRRKSQLHRVDEIHLALLSLSREQRQCRGDLIRAQLHPATTYLDQWLLQGCERLKLVAGERLLAQRDLPVVGDQRIKPHRAHPGGAARAGPLLVQPNANAD